MTTAHKIVEAFVRREYSYEDVADPLSVVTISLVCDATDYPQGVQAGDYEITDEVTGLYVRVIADEVISVWRNW